MSVISVPIMHFSGIGVANSDRRGEPSPYLRTILSQDSGEVEQGRGLTDFKQGLSYGMQEHYEEAIEAFNKAEAKGFKPFELFLFRGQAYHELRKYKEAESDASRAIAIQPTNGHGYQLRATIYQSTGKLKKALKVLSKGITVVPNEAAAKLYQTRGIINLRLNRRNEALTDLSQALSLGNTLPLVYYKRGRAYTELGRYEEAVQDFSEALKRQQDHHRSRLNRGWVNGCLGEFEKSVQDFDQILSKVPDDVLVHGLRGWVRLENDDVDGGLSDLLYAKEHGHSDPWTYLNIASAFYIKGIMDKAIEANAEALALNDPESEAVLYFQRGLLLLVSGKEKEANSAYDRARNVALKNSERLELQEAIADLREAVMLHGEISGAADNILKNLEETLKKTKTSEKLVSKRCQHLRDRQE